MLTKGFNFGVEFTGGSEITVLVHSSDVKEADIREALRDISPEFENVRVARIRTAGENPNESRFSVIVGKTYIVETPESFAKKIVDSMKENSQDNWEKIISNMLGTVAPDNAKELAKEIVSKVKDLKSDDEKIQEIARMIGSYVVKSEKGYITSKVVKALKEKAGVEAEVVSFSEVSGSAAEEIRRGTYTAVVVAIIAILLYITFRFSFIFGVGAIIALVHDVLITLGFISMFNFEMNVPAVAAILTLIGYSLNDTIVVYDRIRENMRRYRQMDVERLVNKSVNEVIVRSLNTSFTTFLVVFLLLLFAEKAIKSFAFGMTIGTIVGTYSSLYIAAPIVIKWVKRH
ncbi:MAG: protein translocase subunit SecF [Thermotogaceae bacterium]|nr:protein translocase subunit SecF [Thermotogaceae bacterium]